MPERQSHVTLTFKPEGEGTLLTLLHEQFFDETTCDGHREGWTGVLDKFERLLAAQAERTIAKLAPVRFEESGPINAAGVRAH